MTKNRIADDEKFMRMALRLAGKARGRTSPNPMVGAVIVKNGRVVASGYHERAGSPHAEVVALAKAGNAAEGGTLYVTLEPCSHTNKRTPPCAPRVIASGIRRAVIAMADPNPQVSGGGIRALRNAGIDVAIGTLEQEARRLNESYCKHITTGMPFVTLKIAQTLDGKIATASGESKWITGEEAREAGRGLRSASDAILVGINTILKDDPLLTTRIAGGRDPVRIVLDSRLRIPLGARVLKDAAKANTIVVSTKSAPKEKTRRLRHAGADVLLVKSLGGRPDLRDLMMKLGKRGIMSVLIEGGSEVHASAIKARVADKVMMFVAPMLMTGKDSLCSIGGKSPEKLRQAVRLVAVTIRVAGQDLLVEGYFPWAASATCRARGRGSEKLR